MKINNLTLKEIPECLRRLPDAPKSLYATCDAAQLNKLLQQPGLAVVGSRNISQYGRQVTSNLANKLARQGVTIISGLALGVDAIAHQAALDAGGLTIAVLPGPLERIYPAGHQQLALRIVANGGILLSEYPAGSETYRWNFIARNRLIAGLADALLITEAATKSGTLHTAGFALDQGKPVLAVPGNITSPTSAGTNTLIKSGATPVLGSNDVLEALGLPTQKTIKAIGRNRAEQAIIDALSTGSSHAEDIQRHAKLDISTFNQTLTMLEISGMIRSQGANHWSLA